MPVQPTYPGVYIEEIPSGVHTITGVATSITAFIGRAKRGLVNTATTITSYADFERIYGGLWEESTLGHSVRDFYLNGGTQAIIVRLFHPYFALPSDETDAQNAGAKKIADAINGGSATTPDAVVKSGSDALTTLDKDETVSQVAKETAQFVMSAVTNALTQADAKASDADKITAIKKAATDAVTRSTVTTAQLVLDTLTLRAASPGTWGNNLRASIDVDTTSKTAIAVAQSLDIPVTSLFNLTVYDANTRTSERFINLTVTKGRRQIDKILELESDLVRVTDLPTTAPKATPAAAVPVSAGAGAVAVGAGAGAGARTGAAGSNGTAKKTPQQLKDENDPYSPRSLVTVGVLPVDVVTDGEALTGADDFTPDQGLSKKIGLYALEQADLFNLLCIPPYQIAGDAYDVEYALVSDAIAYCTTRRAMMIVDSPSTWKRISDATTNLDSLAGVSDYSRNAAFFFPRIVKANPLHENRFEEFAPSGMIAGVFARTDSQRGVWKAPAGLEATLTGVVQLSVPMTNLENGLLNPLGINCLRAFPEYGRVIWGSRTTRGSDQLADDYKYIPVRRTALFIEESLYRGTQWVVFEPNDEPLWAQIRLNVGSFMHDLFRQGAFQGQTPRDAYFVKCDKETTTQSDINHGIVNVLVGFAPLKPAEFVIIQLQQMAGQIEV